jgi:hypothetical protein
MILRNVSSLTSSEPFSRPDLSSDREGYSAPESVTTVWHEGSEEDIIDRGKILTRRVLQSVSKIIFNGIAFEM